MKKAILVAHGEGGQGTFSIPKASTITPANTDLTFAKAKEYMGSNNAWPEYSSTSYGLFDGLSDADCKALFGSIPKGKGFVSTGLRRGGFMDGPLIYTYRGDAEIGQKDIEDFIAKNGLTSIVLLACRGN